MGTLGTISKTSNTHTLNAGGYGMTRQGMNTYTYS